MGTKPLKALRGYRASNRGSKNRQSRLPRAPIEGLGASNRGSQNSRKTPGALRGSGPCSGAPSPSMKFQSRLKFSISLENFNPRTFRMPHKNRGLAGGSLENFNPA